MVRGAPGEAPSSATSLVLGSPGPAGQAALFGCYTRAKRMTQAALIALAQDPEPGLRNLGQGGCRDTSPAQVRQPWHCSCSQSCSQAHFQTKPTLLSFKDKQSLQHSQDFTFLTALQTAGSRLFHIHAPASSVTSCTIFPQLGLCRSSSSVCHSLATPGCCF